MPKEIVKKARKLADAFCRIGVLYGMFSLVSYWAWGTLHSTVFQKNTMDFWNQTLYFQVSYGYSLLIFFSLASVFQIHNFKLKDAFYNTAPNSLISGLLFLMKQVSFWVECLALTVFAFLFSSLPPLSFFRRGVLPRITESNALGWLIAITIFVSLYFLASVATVSWWSRYGHKKEKKHSLKLFVFQLCYTLPLWGFGGLLLSVMYPLLSGFFILFYKFWWIFLILFISLFMIVTSIQYLSVFYHRRKFLKKFYGICKKNGYSYSTEGRPCLELISSAHRFQITVRTENKAYRCRFVGGLQRKSPLHLREDGIAEYAKFRVLWSHVVLDPYEFSAEDNEKKILIVCPCHGKIYAKDGSAERRLEPGDRANGYQIHTPEDFLGGFGRNCL